MFDKKEFPRLLSNFTTGAPDERTSSPIGKIEDDDDESEFAVEFFHTKKVEKIF